MKISINKESSVPIRDQLVEQVSLQIASGALDAGVKLPSIRALASRLDIHYSTVTAAYNHLAEVGLLEIRQGSGVRVASLGGGFNKEQEKKALDMLFGDFLARASESGYSISEVQDCVKRLSKRKAVKRILVVDRNVDFHPVILSELSPHFSIPVEACTVEEILENPFWSEEALIVTSLYHLFSFKNAIADRTRLVPCNIEPARSELQQVSELKGGSLLLLVSVSNTLMTMATKLVAAQRGEEVAVRSVLSTDEKELSYTIGFADLILCDRPSEELVKRLANGKKTKCFKLYPDSTIDLIKTRLSKWG
ncbi:MAG: GntR family transcriptional regulator [Candidatus Obscuribacterales bacterium]|nr:GntR family transcriptional regulator [Candidatus Obscuribacterales bacterium]